VPDEPDKSWHNVHPDFDGHLERPLAKMTYAERLDLAWEHRLLEIWLRSIRFVGKWSDENAALANPQDHQHPSSS
jgi:hypothetical protein